MIEARSPPIILSFVSVPQSPGSGNSDDFCTPESGSWLAGVAAPPGTSGGGQQICLFFLKRILHVV